MGITNSNKEVSVSTVECGGSFNITLSLAAEPDITSNPADIVLLLDRSTSMAGSALTSLKAGALRFIEVIDEATDGSLNGSIGGGTRIGIVSYADTAVQDVPLTTSVATLNNAVNALIAGGGTNQADAFTKALALFDATSANQKIMVLFTDGNSTVGADPAAAADAAKDAGAVIYVIGLEGENGLDIDALSEWASEPVTAYLTVTPDEEALDELFERLAENIVNTGATGIVIRDVINPCFSIVSLSSPTKGVATLIGNTSVEWRINELGVTASEGASLTFTVEHTGTCTGEVEVNESVIYSDNEGNIVTFPSPVITLDCGTVITEPCPEPVAITVSGCNETVEIDAGDIVLGSLGRIVQLDVTLQNVCPNKRVALAVMLTETDAEGNEYQRGMKTLVIPAQGFESCRDVTVRCIKFVLPEELDASEPDGVFCNTRTFNARILANYIDAGFTCCDTDGE